MGISKEKQDLFKSCARERLEGFTKAFNKDIMRSLNENMERFFTEEGNNLALTLMNKLTDEGFEKGVKKMAGSFVQAEIITFTKHMLEDVFKMDDKAFRESVEEGERLSKELIAEKEEKERKVKKSG